jgi:hypothetical protein
MADVSLEAIPSTPTDSIFPVWTDLVNNWRAVDCHWLRDRAVQIFPDVATRTSALDPSAIPGMLSYITGTDSLEMRKANNTWEAVRYPNVGVTSDAASALLKYAGSGSGLSLVKAGTSTNDGSVAIVNFFAGTGTYQSPLSTSTGVTIDATGLSIKVGTKVVKLATDATQLTINSPISVTGDITSSTTLKAPAATLTGALTAASAALSGALTANVATITTTLTATGGVQGGSAGNAEITFLTTPGLAVFRHHLATGFYLGYDSSGNCTITSATATTLAGSVQTPANGTGTLSSRGTTYLNQDPPNSAVTYSQTNGSMSSAAVAGCVAFNRAPTTTDVYPDGTIWFQV